MKKPLFCMVVVCVFMLSGLVLAGVEPEPFIGQLGAVENILNSQLKKYIIFTHSK